jgi:hypothetical protein
MLRAPLNSGFANRPTLGRFARPAAK